MNGTIISYLPLSKKRFDSYQQWLMHRIIARLFINRAWGPFGGVYCALRYTKQGIFFVALSSQPPHFRPITNVHQNHGMCSLIYTVHDIMAPFNSTNISSITNSTFALSSDAEVGSTSLLSGPTIFWAMLAIAFNAMGQDSPTARAVFDSGDVESRLLVPYLSSPIFCLSDILVDCYQILSGLRKPAEADSEEVRGGSFRSTASLSTTISVRTILFMFGVLPQAIRLYGVSGIVWTQTLATVYLATALVRLLRTIVISTASTKNNPTLKQHQKITAQAFLIVAHLAAYLYLWHDIAKADTFSIDGSNPIFRTTQDTLLWTRIISLLVFIPLAMAWFANSLFEFNRRFLYFSPWWLFFVFMMLHFMTLYTLVQSGDLSQTGAFPPEFIRVTPLFGLAVISSFICATLLAKISKKLLPVDESISGEPEITNTQPDLAQELGIPLAPLPIMRATETQTITIAPDARTYSNQSPAVSQPTSSQNAPSVPSETATQNVDHIQTIWLHGGLAMSILMEENLFCDPTILQMVRPNYVWTSDLMLKIGMTARLLRKSVSILPRAITQAFQPSTSSSGSSNGESRTRLKDSLRNLATISISLTITWWVFCWLVLGAASSGMHFLQHLWTPFERISNEPLTFAILNLITAGLWYSRVWTGSGTTVPSWESWLG